MSTILKILEDRENYLKYSKYVKEHTVSKEEWLILKAMKDWFDKHESLDKISWEPFATYFKLTKAGTNADKNKIYSGIFSRLQEDMEEEAEAVLRSLIERDYSVKISDHLLRVAEGDDTRSVRDILPMIESYSTDMGGIEEDDPTLINDSWEHLFDRSLEPGLDWRLPELNRSVGPIRSEDFIIVAASPNSGKTTFLCSEASFMASQLPEDKQVVWFNNEEKGKKVKRRFLQSVIQWTSEEIEADMLGAVKKMEDVLGGRDKIKLFNLKEMDTTYCLQRLRNSNPGLIVFDQLWQIQMSGIKFFSESQMISKIFHWGRAMGQKFDCPIMAAHQVDGTAQGVKYIEQHQLYMSRVAVQGEMDAGITLGKSYDPSERYVRGLKIVKNKLDGGPKTIKEEREDMVYDVELDPFRARFKSRV